MVKQHQAKVAAAHRASAPAELLEVVEEHQIETTDEAPSVAVCILELPCQVIALTGARTAMFTLLTDAVLIGST
jgi:hypothetical protein